MAKKIPKRQVKNDQYSFYENNLFLLFLNIGLYQKIITINMTKISYKIVI
jgi:hypothetical protein